MRQKGIAILLTAAMVCTLFLTGCAGSNGDSSGVRNSTAMIMVGVAMNQAAGDDGQALKSALESKGYTVELASSTTANEQSDQLEAMVEDGASVLIVDPVDTASAAQTLKSDAVDTSDVAVIAYRDQLPDGVADSYVGRDAREMGSQQAQHIVERLLLDDRTDSVTIELVTDHSGNGAEAFEGAMEVFKPYLDAGKLEILSGAQTAADCVAEDAGAWAKGLFTNEYAEQELRAILCLGEGQAVQVVDAVCTSYPGTIYPVVTGADCTPESLEYMSKSLLDMVSIYEKDDLTEQAVQALEPVHAGKGKDAYLLKNTAVTTETYEELLLNSGYFTANGDGTFTEN